MKMVYVLVAALAAGAAVAGVRSLAAPAVPEPPAQERAQLPASHADGRDDEAAPAPASGAIEGEVLEVIAVEKYAYLRVGAKGSEGTWTAVPVAKVSVGDHVRVVNAVEMTDFKSTTLGRTFPSIYFGMLDGGASPHGDAPHAGLAPGDDPHAGASQSDVDVKRVDRAEGPNGRTVAEVLAQREKLAGKTVRIRATVVKATPGVLGKTWLHLRDGSGADGKSDLTVTTDATPALGATVVVEGVVVLDRDVGAGYRFPTLVEDAKVVTP